MYYKKAITIIKSSDKNSDKKYCSFIGGKRVFYKNY